MAKVAIAVWAILVSVMVPTPVQAVEGTDNFEAGVALFEGRLIDLRDGWGEAEACMVPDDGPSICFRSEHELEAHIGRSSSAPALEAVMSSSSTCSSSLKLYDGTNYTGSTLYLYQRSVWINLSDYGFSNRTSSFKVGACSSYLADYSNGGGSWYATSATQAWDVAPSMASGWNNRVSSVYIT